MFDHGSISWACEIKVRSTMHFILKTCSIAQKSIRSFLYLIIIFGRFITAKVESIEQSWLQSYEELHLQSAVLWAESQSPFFFDFCFSRPSHDSSGMSSTFQQDHKWPTLCVLLTSHCPIHCQCSAPRVSHTCLPHRLKWLGATELEQQALPFQVSSEIVRWIDACRVDTHRTPDLAKIWEF